MQVLVLAAGRSTRIQHPTTKMLHELGEAKILRRVLSNLEAAGLRNIYLVLGHQAELIQQEFPDYRYIIQPKQLGTGHAVQCCKPLRSAEHTLVVFGDKPLFSPHTLHEFTSLHEASCRVMTISTVEHPLPESYAEGYGTVVRSAGKVVALHKVQGTIECDGGLYAFQTKWLWDSIDTIAPTDKGRGKKEYFLPDLVEIATTQGLAVGEYRIRNYREATGINTPAHLEEAKHYLAAQSV